MLVGTSRRGLAGVKQNMSRLIKLVLRLFLTTVIGVALPIVDKAQQNDPAVINFSSAAFEVSEGVGVAHVVVQRSGNISGPSSVDFSTDDRGAASTCSEFNGLASSRCDFNTALGTLNFAPGETDKSFDVVINRDSYVEAPFEKFTVKLSNPTGGAILGTTSQSSVQIDDRNDGSPAAAVNIIDRTTSFVRQQYHDFLNREPDAAGLAFWVDNIDKCDDPDRLPSNMTVSQCKEIMRINTSAAFFLSIEFLQTGGLVHACYAAALDRPEKMPGYLEFVRDTQSVSRGVIVGEANWEQTLNENREAFLKDFVMRPGFVELYPTVDSPVTYVNKLYLHALGRSATGEEMEQGINEFGTSLSATDSGARGRVLLRLTQSTDARDEFNRAFVQMQYVGYLRRNPNEFPDFSFAGSDFWLEKLNSFNGNFIEAEMVKAFLASQEYRSRFGS
jgi:Calx-beta domain.